MGIQEIITKKLTSTITGIAGEYYVAAELSRRGFMASIMLRNTEGVDIQALNLEENKLFTIQVKTNQKGERQWLVGLKAELLTRDNLFYVFVSFKGEVESPKFYIVPSKIVADYVNDIYKKRQQNNPKFSKKDDQNVRFKLDGEKYLANWDLLS